VEDIKQKITDFLEEFLNYNTLYLSGKQIAALLAVCALFLGALVFRYSRENRPAELSKAATASSTVSTPARTHDPAPKIVVYVCGQVAKPGVYRLPKGVRLADALKAASGTTPRADLNAVNLAVRLLDGEKIYIPFYGETGGAAAAGEGGSGGGAGGLIELNSATAAELNSLPGIGEVLAEKIIAERELSPFKKVSDLKKVEGIGEKKYRQLKDLVVVR
jgi:competence protein ComEA